MLLLPETVAHQDGKGPEIALDSSGIPMLLNLGITHIIEDECLEVTVWGSPDHRNWHRLATFPQKFYCGDYSLPLDLSMHPDIRFVRAEWKICRRSPEGREPLFGFHLAAERVLVRHAGVG